MASHPSLFAASRRAAEEIMSEPIRFETNDNARIRAFLRQTHTDEQIDTLLEHYEYVQLTRKRLNLNL